MVPTYEINCVAHNLSSNEIGGKVVLETDKGGTGYATSQQKYATENTTVRLFAVAEPGYQFVAWRKGSPTDANANVSTNAEYEFTATEAVWMYAVFEYTPECTIDCTVFDITNGINNGQIGVGGTVSIQTDKGSVEGATPLPIQATRNSSVTVNAVAASGYEFLGWKKASPYVQDFVATTASYTFDINEELYLYAVFQEAANVPTYTVSGSVTSFNDASGDITLWLIPEGSSEPAYETTVKGNTVDYSFADVVAGTYTLKVSKANHVTREYTVVVGDTSVLQDAKIHLKGDINGDGRVNVSDVGLANAHAKKVSTLEGYQFDCANVNGDARITISDVGLLNAHAKKTSLLW